MRIDKILGLLDKVKSSGADKWTACCPAHDDKSPSLALTETSDGRILIHCFAGCGGAETLNAIGLTLSDLYPDGPTGNWFSFGYRKNPEKDPQSQDRLVLLLAACDIANGKQLSNKDRVARDISFRKLHKVGKAIAVMEEAKIIKSGGSVSYGKDSTLSKNGLKHGI